jgi:[calcium/calmodulin-dependent protein kinase] kinase
MGGYDVGTDSDSDEEDVDDELTYDFLEFGTVDGLDIAMKDKKVEAPSASLPPTTPQRTQQSVTTPGGGKGKPRVGTPGRSKSLNARMHGRGMNPLNPQTPRSVRHGTSVVETNEVHKTKLGMKVDKLPHPVPKSGDWLSKRKMINNYIVLESLGSGTYAEVRKCKERGTGAVFALKIIQRKDKVQQLSKSILDVRKEIAIMKKLVHPNVLRLYEVMDDPKMNKLYLVVEYMERGDLMAWQQSRMGVMGKQLEPGQVMVPFTEQQLWHTFRHVTSGLRYLHHQRIVHGDIKPHNLLMGECGVVKLADFGISHSLSGSTQKLLDTAGTPAFMSPELCSGEEYSGQLADVWAMAATMFMLAFGRPPWTASKVTQLYKAIQYDPLVFPESTKVDPQLQDLLAGMMRKTPNERMTLDEVVNHTWLRRGKAPAKPDNFKQIVVSEDDINAAIEARRQDAGPNHAHHILAHQPSGGEADPKNSSGTISRQGSREEVPQLQQPPAGRGAKSKPGVGAGMGSSDGEHGEHEGSLRKNSVGLSTGSTLELNSTDSVGDIAGGSSRPPSTGSAKSDDGIPPAVEISPPLVVGSAAAGTVPLHGSPGAAESKGESKGTSPLFATNKSTSSTGRGDMSEAEASMRSMMYRSCASSSDAAADDAPSGGGGPAGGLKRLKGLQMNQKSKSMGKGANISQGTHATWTSSDDESDDDDDGAVEVEGEDSVGVDSVGVSGSNGQDDASTSPKPGEGVRRLSRGGKGGPRGKGGANGGGAVPLHRVMSQELTQDECEVLQLDSSQVLESMAAASAKLKAERLEEEAKRTEAERLERARMARQRRYSDDDDVGDAEGEGGSERAERKEASRHRRRRERHRLTACATGTTLPAEQINGALSVCCACATAQGNRPRQEDRYIGLC